MYTPVARHGRGSTVTRGAQQMARNQKPVIVERARKRRTGKDINTGARKTGRPFINLYDRRVQNASRSFGTTPISDCKLFIRTDISTGPAATYSCFSATGDRKFR